MEKVEIKSVESTANYEGNATLLLLERVKNPVIRAQILDLLFKNEESKEGTFLDVVEKKDGKIVEDQKGNLVFKKVPYIQASMEELGENLNLAIEEAARVTDISFDANPHAMSNSSLIKMKSIAPWNNKPFNENQMSSIEAHEKGHNIRDYSGPFFDTYFKDAFRFDTDILTKEDIRMFKKGMDEEDQAKSDEEIKEIYVGYMSDAREIAERMSQLKNYFSMSGDDVFTREHLQYAREHYVKDTDLDNGMKFFFDAIKPETEDEFLRLINCSGI